MWVEFVVGSRPCSERFSPGTPVFLSPQKSTFPNSNSALNSADTSERVATEGLNLSLICVLLFSPQFYEGVGFKFDHNYNLIINFI